MNARRLVPLIALVAAGCGGGRTTVPEPSGSVFLVSPTTAGADVVVPIRVQSARSVALQFDLEFDADVLMFKDANPSSAIHDLGKQLSARGSGKGRVRVVVFGMNLDAIPSGDLGQVRFRAMTTRERTNIHAVRLYAASADGRDLRTAVRNGEIVVLEER